MDSKEHNPWTWQDSFGFADACEVTGATRILTLSGQCATTPRVRLSILAIMAGQLALAVANLGEFLKVAGITCATSDVDADHKRLKTAEIRFNSAPVSVGPMRVCDCWDPDGNFVELPQITDLASDILLPANAA